MHTDSVDNEKKNLEDSPKVRNVMGKHLRPAVIYLFLIILGLSLLPNLHLFAFQLLLSTFQLWELLVTRSIFHYLPLSRTFIISWRSLHCCLILHYWGLQSKTLWFPSLLAFKIKSVKDSCRTLLKTIIPTGTQLRWREIKRTSISQ